MGRLRLSAVALALLSSIAVAGAVGGAAGCDQKGKDAEAARADDVPVMSIDDLAVRIASSTCRAVDANGAQLRKDVGVIPGAVLLTDYEAFSLTELPEDKSTPLVFYCANEQCDASHVAARRARSAGWEHVHVLSAGILGWAKAGRAVDKPTLL
jgi:rhodanese-related sulfurtransferase